MKYVIGLDYGTDSVRALVVNAENGAEVATHVHNYTRWAKGLYCHNGPCRRVLMPCFIRM